ncbi:hypothetical protein JOF53_001338 [Crossiella equi]|uniref:Uncharacterized protein n=1 Tax=Crossiella equi TaxID=130796 RepID=A0ABS5A7D0_9PSEU|nr:hypothetical protein [Crossiella equi]MBP2472466.1 hypothetical protein [Crossiella equi]
MVEDRIAELAGRLRASWRPGVRAVELAEVLQPEIRTHPLLALAAIRQVFGVPIWVGKEAYCWVGLSPGAYSLSDEQFEALLAPWVGKPPRPPGPPFEVALSDEPD